MGGLLGLGAGYLLMRLLEDVLGMTLTMSAGVAELAIGFSMAVGVIFGLYPADKASKLKPIERCTMTERTGGGTMQQKRAPQGRR